MVEVVPRGVWDEPPRSHRPATETVRRDCDPIGLRNIDDESAPVIRTNRSSSAPIVLAHGLFGFDRLGVGPWTVATYFRGIPAALRAEGHRVLVTAVHPTAGIARRAELLGRQILAAFPDEPVHVIGHSMGGLDARVLLADPAWHGRIRSLTTIATPHHGSTLAEVARRRLGPVYRLLHALGLDHQGFLDVTPERARRLDEALPSPPSGVACYSIAGDPPPEEVGWSLRPLFRLMERWEGANDGLVSVTSSEAFGTPLPAWPSDHMQQTNWGQPPWRHRLQRPVTDRYCELVDLLNGRDGALAAAGAGLVRTGGSAPANH